MFVDNNRGDVSIYIALIAAAVITSAAIALSGVLSVQIRLVRDVISSERAFYAADSGIEEAQFKLFALRIAGQREGEVTVEEGEIEYEDEAATFEAEGELVSDPFGVYNCLTSLGRHAGDQRRISIRTTAGCDL
ncbi:MAG: hypothetical protein HYZ61_01665 [Candidatus Andersenbacteria bacterium]|nr:hypothetical protein [Candidatus Andersenbacteria bacterium]